MPQLLSLRYRAQEPQVLKPVSSRVHVLQQEKILQQEGQVPQRVASALHNYWKALKGAKIQCNQNKIFFLIKTKKHKTSIPK